MRTGSLDIVPAPTRQALRPRSRPLALTLAAGVRAEEAARRGGHQGAGAAGACRLPAQWTAAGAGAGVVADNWLVDVPRRSADRGGRRSHRAQRRPARRRGARRAGAALRQAGGREAVSVGRSPRARRRQDVGRRLGHSGRRCSPLNWELDLWGRVRYGRAAAPPTPRRRRPISSTRGSRSRRSWPRAGSSPPRRGCRRSWRAQTIRRERGARAPGRDAIARRRRQRRGRRTWRAPTSAPIATRCVSSSWRANRRSARSSSCSAGIPPAAASVSAAAARAAGRGTRPGCRRSCSSAARTSSPPSGASRPPSTGSARPRRRGCRRSP